MGPLPFGFLNAALKLPATVNAIRHPLELLKAELTCADLLQILIKTIPTLWRLKRHWRCWRQSVALHFNPEQLLLPESKTLANGHQ